MGAPQEGSGVGKAEPDDKHGLCSRSLLLLNTIPASQILLGSSFVPLLCR
jgi:hypothetical protein